MNVPLRRLLLVLATALATVLPLGTPAAAAPADLTEVPYPMDSSNQAAWWTPVATYRGAGEYAYFAFNEPGSQPGTHRVAIARRDPSGGWSRLPVLNGGGPAEYTDDIGHNQPSMARDGSGRFHVFASMHNNTWRYFRSDTTGGAPTNHAADLPDQGKNVTYPVLTSTPEGDLYLIARVQEGTRRAGNLYHWDNDASSWSKVGSFAAADGRSVYPDDLQVDSAGDLHLLFEWSLAPSSAFRHELSYLKYSPSTGVFRDHAGAEAAVPVTPASADVIQPIEAGESYQDEAGPAVQSAKLTLDGTSPKVAYRYRLATSGGLFHVRYAYLRDGAWARQTVYSGGQTTAALGLTWDETEGKRVYFATASGADRARVATESGGTWSSASVAPGLPIDRLAVRRNASGQDILYLVDTQGGRLHYARN
ncbi:BNR-4 repeat-containing protein [Streptomyces radicis]|nr:BNR-4 repeat-containing protein [Streptomyces radicis]